MAFVVFPPTSLLLAPSSIPNMAPYDPAVLDAIPSLEPMRLVLVPLKCFYCDCAVEEDIREWRICHLFGLFHCGQHSAAAQRDCEEYMRREGIVRMWDAQQHPVLGPFLTALGTTIPMLRSSGVVDTNWRFPILDEMPLIRRSRTTGAWGFNLTNGVVDKFAPLSQFRDPRVSPILSEEVRRMLEAVEAALTSGVYS